MEWPKRARTAHGIVRGYPWPGNMKPLARTGSASCLAVNIFDYDWQTTGKRVKVKDPIYHQDHTFEGLAGRDVIGQIRRFAAGEFSNCVWGFYLEKNG